MARPRYKEGEEVELIPDAWGTFERAVKAMAKAAPQHKSAKTKPAAKSRKKAAKKPK